MSEGLEALTKLVRVVMSYRPDRDKEAKSPHTVRAAGQPKAERPASGKER